MQVKSVLSLPLIQEPSDAMGQGQDRKPQTPQQKKKPLKVVPKETSPEPKTTPALPSPQSSNDSGQLDSPMVPTALVAELLEPSPPLNPTRIYKQVAVRTDKLQLTRNLTRK